MAILNGNANYIQWNGVDLSALWAGEISFDDEVDLEDITAGSGATHIDRAAKLSDNKIDLMAVYDDALLNTYVTQLKSGTKATLVWGPEGSASGKPKFSGTMILKKSSFSQNVEKKMVAFKLSFEGASRTGPTHNPLSGGTF